ncbi:DUF438 domain-containing protein [Desulfosporosinus meridiei]|uniref:PAC domain-containing protein n=1 Tax=Desulfosporosinus meridiei (strain ATCC BAA-275 / DSM 13257 / KCTC 12902 / NCIMB 13706 / S10) TaxID=768704 RepID=J7IY67_DESMD|nr:DUF438 domain-containing protein [Desulfosporosinus meridiei]AFQ45079.1 hypothetical protein Desmer_3198 [Desulfosporosinus meridiei DSM 13257]
MTQPVLDLTRSLYDLTEDYPELIPILHEMGLEGATNSILRKTVGRKLPVAEGLKRHGISLEEAKRKLEAKGFCVVSEDDPSKDRKERREQLKEIIRDIHRQEDPAELRERFKDLLRDVGATEIAQLEQELIQEGLHETEIKSLCDVHAAVFEEGLNNQVVEEVKGGHPVHTFKKENREIEKIVAELSKLFELLSPSEKTPAKHDLVEWQQLHERLCEIEKHYSRKENILFAYLEKHGVNAPPKVMWAIHDDIRALLKEVSKFLQDHQPNNQEVKQIIERTARPALKMITDMIYKEENIMFPMCLDTLTDVEWAEIAEQSAEIGYLVNPDVGWKPVESPEGAGSLKQPYIGGGALGGSEAEISFETGVLTQKQLNLLLNNLPVDITFVDEQDRVKYFTFGKERIFQRSKAIIGRQVQNCHPPDSVHIVEEILEDFRSGKNDNAKFWLHLGDKYVYIQYFALRDDQGNYAGTIEVSQDIQGIQEIQGEKRIL